MKSAKAGATLAFVAMWTAATRLPGADAAPAAAAESDRILGSAGKEMPGAVLRYSWPRTDLQVDVGGVRVEPPLALGSWAAFHGAGNETVVMGDLALLATEVSPVARTLDAAGFEILAIHNHLIGETPRVARLRGSSSCTSGEWEHPKRSAAL